MDAEDGESKCKLPPQCFKQFQRLKKHSKELKCAFSIVKELVDCILDWLLFTQLCLVEEGLVFGPINISILFSVAFFSCIGTVVSAIDIANRLCDYRTGRPFVNIGNTEACVMWLEDIPQLILGIVIAKCNREAFSVITFTKATIIIVWNFYTFHKLIPSTCSECIDTLDKWKCITMTDTEGRQCRLERTTGCFILIFLGLTTMAAAIDSLVPDLDLKHNKKDLRKDEFDSHQSDFDLSDTPMNTGRKEKYFFKVGIYSDVIDHQIQATTVGSMKWMKFFDVNEIITHGEITTRVTTNINYTLIQNFYTRPLVHINASYSCYNINRSYSDSMYFTKASFCPSLNGTTFHYQFQYQPPSWRYTLGDIRFNLVKHLEGSCHPVALENVPKVRYFRAKSSQNATGHFNFLGRLKNESQYTFYSKPDDLVDIVKLWQKDRSNACDSAGSISPHFNKDISVPCHL